MNKLRKDELIAVRDEIFAVIEESQLRRSDLVSSGQMTSDESRIIGSYEQSLRDLAGDLNRAILRIIITDISKPRDRIVTITKDVKNAIQELETLNDFIGILAAVISLITTVITAFSSGNPLQLVGLIDQIDALV